MKHPLTIVLPLHNVERQIGQIVRETLEVAQTVSPSICVILVDDGSTDGTYEEACLLARQYPQIKVLRLPVQASLGAVIDLVKQEVSVDQILMHDGNSPMDTSRLNRMLRTGSNRSDTKTVNESLPASLAKQATNRFSNVATVTPSLQEQAINRFSNVATVDKSMQWAHRPILEFQWIRLDRPAATKRSEKGDGKQAATPGKTPEKSPEKSLGKVLEKENPIPPPLMPQSRSRQDDSSSPMSPVIMDPGLGGTIPSLYQ